MAQKRICDECGEDIILNGGFFHLELVDAERPNPKWDFCSRECIRGYFERDEE